MSAAEVDSVAQGRVWSGRAAHQLGLVDSLGGISVAVAAARQKAGIRSGDSVRLEPFPERRGPFFQKALRSFLDDEDERSRVAGPGIPEGLATWLRAASFPSGAVLALLPFTIETR